MTTARIEPMTQYRDILVIYIYTITIKPLDLSMLSLQYTLTTLFYCTATIWSQIITININNHHCHLPPPPPHFCYHHPSQPPPPSLAHHHHCFHHLVMWQAYNMTMNDDDDEQ